MEPQKSNGALVGSVIIVVILIIGGLYLWKANMAEQTLENGSAAEQEGEVTDESAAELEAELNSMDLESLDEGI